MTPLMIEVLLLGTALGVLLLLYSRLASVPSLLERILAGQVASHGHSDVSPGAETGREVQTQRDVSPSGLEPGKALVLGSQGRPLLELSFDAFSTDPSPDAVDLKSPAKAKVERLLEQVAGEAGRTLIPTAGTFRLVFSPEAQKQLAEGTLEIVKAPGGLRAWLIDKKSGTIGEHGRLVDGLSSPAAVATLGWQVLAIVTSQQFLAEIDRKLARISNGIESVMRWLEDEERGVLLGNYRYLVTAHRTLSTQECTEHDQAAFVVQFEHIDRECLKVQSAALLRLRAELAALKALKHEKVTWKEACGRAKTILGQCRRDFDSILLALRIRTLTVNLRATMPVPIALLTSRIQESMAELTGARITCQELLNALGEPKDTFDHWFRLAKVKEEYQREIGQELERVRQECHALLETTEDQVHSLATSFKERLATAHHPIVLEVVRDSEGRILQARHEPPGSDCRSTSPARLAVVEPA